MATTGGDTAVYVSNAGSGELQVFRLEAASGELRRVQSLGLGGRIMPLALSPDRRFLYAARRSAPMEVLSFAVRRSDGLLDPLGAAPLPDSMAYLSTDRSGRFLLSASYGGNLIAVSPIGAEGVAREAQQVVATPPKAHAIHADPSNRFVFATSLGGGVVLQFRFDATTGRLTPNLPAELSPHPGASPRHFVFSADGGVVYLLGELDGAVDVLRLNAGTGTLRRVQSVSSLPPGLAGAPWAADLHLSPDGRFLFCSERRSATLTTFRVDPADGTLAALAHTVTEPQPRSFAITPDGGFLIVAGESSDHLAVHAVDAATGVLELRARCPAGAGPNWVECIAIGR